MGNPASEPSDQTDPITHFSHPHPLHLLNSLPNLACSACKLAAAGPVYTCTSCNFLLHPKCYKLPQQITHPFHQTHTLSLHSKPVYPEGIFRCDACGNKGDGFCYRCSPCGVDLHTICASLPLEFTHQCHHHQLSLTFAAPYPGNTFSCDICKRVGSKTWIYRCNVCGFDVHLTCVANIIPVATVHQQTQIFTTNPPNYMGSNYGAQNQIVGSGYPAGVVQMTTRPYSNLNQPAYINGGVRPVNGGIMDQLMVGAANDVASAVAQSATQALLQGVVGGGGVIMDGGGGAHADGGNGIDGGYSGGDGSY